LSHGKSWAVNIIFVERAISFADLELKLIHCSKVVKRSDPSEFHLGSNDACCYDVHDIWNIWCGDFFYIREFSASI